MKLEKYRQKINKLYVLGAGASFALSKVKVRKNKFVRETTPLDKDFLNRLNEFIPTRGWQRGSTKYLADEWLDRDDFFESPLETAIIRRASQYDFLSSLHPRSTKEKATNADYLNHLSHLIADFLKKCKANGSGDARKFVDGIFPKGVDVADYKNRVVTFNYDTLVERPLFDRGISRKKIYFDRIALTKGDGVKRNADEKFIHPLILKLHGSTNWRCSRTYFDSIITGQVEATTAKEQIWVDDLNCPKPMDADSPLIIPPIPNKPITAASIFLHLWTLAYEYLHEAEELIIVGYSCPPTDTLARTMFTHFTAKRLTKITIVDPDAMALSRYRQLVPEKIASKAKWSYYSDFSEYINGEFGKL